MTAKSIMLVGGPDSGKTNYLGVLWAILISGDGCVKASEAPGNIEYVEKVLGHLNQGRFAPRSESTLEAREHHLTVKLARQVTDGKEEIELTVPDVRGEIWKIAVEDNFISTEWFEKLQEATGALLFLRVRSNQNVVPLDWVTAKGLLEHVDVEQDHKQLPTQVFLCELLRLLAAYLKRDRDSPRPRVAIVITAWDLMDPEAAAAGPMAYLKSEYPLFAGRLADIEEIEVRTFAVSAVGGDLKDDDEFKQRFPDLNLANCGYAVSHNGAQVERVNDIALPVSWLVSD